MVIGIVGRPAFTDIKNKGVLIYKTICEILYHYDCIPVGLIPSINGMDFDKELNIDEYEKMIKVLDVCDGIILQGGECMNNYDIMVAKYLYDSNKPTLGICLGMQTMGVALNGSLVNFPYHNKDEKYAHYVKINKNSRLYEIIGKEYIYVNSRHNDGLYQTSLDKVAYFKNCIEAVEDKNKKFYIGVQWHPESLNDENSERLFTSFIEACKSPTNNI